MQIDGRHFLVHTHVNVETPAEGLGRLHEQAVAFAYDAADVIRQAAVGVRYVPSFLEQYYFRILSVAAYASCRSGSAGHPSNYEYLHRKTSAYVFPY